MSRKHAELEREFIEDLEPRTGRSLAAWMAAIEAAGLTDKNAIIDWLRPQGLTFAHASWLERIHNNDGRPIYGEPAERPAPTSAPLPPSPAPPPPARKTERPAQPLADNASVAPTTTSLADLLARAKGLRPLAELLIREIAQAVPATTTPPVRELVSFARAAEYAVLLVGARELRLGLDLGDTPCEGTIVAARLPGASARITHMVVISDARQIGTPLLDLVRRADGRANPAT